MSIVTTDLHEPPARLTLLGEEARLLLRRNWWIMGLLLGANFLADWWSVVFDMSYWSQMSDTSKLVLSTPGEPFWTNILPARIVKALLAGAWGYLIWRDMEPRGSSSWSGQPESRFPYFCDRIAIGAVLLLTIILTAFYQGIGLSSLFVRVDALAYGFLPPVEVAILFLSLLNIYLFASLLVLTTRRPLSSLFVYSPVIVSVFFAFRVFVDITLVRLICLPVLPPWGFLGGLGIEIWDRAGNTISPAMWAPVIWFVILSAAVVFAAARHRDS